MFSRFIVVCIASISMVAGARAADCTALTPADLQKVAGLKVTVVPFMSKPGAGGHCANFAGDDGKLVLGISLMSSSEDYRNGIASVPQMIYPQRIQLKGVGDEGQLMKSSTGFLRYLVARKGEHGVILFPFGKKLSDAQVEQLASIALGR